MALLSQSRNKSSFLSLPLQIFSYQRAVYFHSIRRYEFLDREEKTVVKAIQDLLKKDFEKAKKRKEQKIYETINSSSESENYQGPSKTFQYENSKKSLNSSRKQESSSSSSDSENENENKKIQAVMKKNRKSLAKDLMTAIRLRKNSMKKEDDFDPNYEFKHRWSDKPVIKLKKL